VITRLVEDAIAEGWRRLDAARPASAEAVRGLSQPVIAFSAPIAAADAGVKQFLSEHMYRHPQVLRVTDDARSILLDLFRRYAEAPALMGEDWSSGLEALLEGERRRRVADFIAGMTDGYAVQQHRRLFDATPDLR
jgi:dGTPase